MFIAGYIITYMGFKAMTANPDCSEQDMELFFLYCSPNVMLMTVAVFLVARKISIKSDRLIAMAANITKCGLGIYMVHYFMVGFSYGIADALAIPVALRIPVTALLAFSVSWLLVSICYRWSPRYSKWIFG